MQTCMVHSLSLASVKSRLVLPFWDRLTRVVWDKWPLNGCVCACVLLLLLSINLVSTEFADPDCEVSKKILGYFVPK